MRIGEILIQQKLLTREALAEALAGRPKMGLAVLKGALEGFIQRIAA